MDVWKTSKKRDVPGYYCCWNTAKRIQLSYLYPLVIFCNFLSCFCDGWFDTSFVASETENTDKDQAEQNDSLILSFSIVHVTKETDQQKNNTRIFYSLANVCDAIINQNVQQPGVLTYLFISLLTGPQRPARISKTTLLKCRERFK